MNDVVIVSGTRTPVGDFLGSLKDLNSVELGVIALKAAMEQAHIDPKLIEEVVCGNPDMAGAKSNPGRQVAIHAGCPWETFACTVNQQCVSSMRASEILYQEILLGKVDAGAAVGCASMSNIPYLVMGARTGFRMGEQQPHRRHVQRRHDRCLLQHPHGRHRGEHRGDVPHIPRGAGRVRLA